MQQDRPNQEEGDNGSSMRDGMLRDLRIGLWYSEHLKGLLHLDAETARLLGLPAEAVTLSEAAVRARFHSVDWHEMDSIVRQAVARNHVAEGRLRVVDQHGTVLRAVRSRTKPLLGCGERGERTVELVGALQEVAEQPPDATQRSSVTGDWRRSREAFLLDAGRALAEAVSTEEVLRVAAGLSMPGFEPAGLAVFQVEGDRLQMIGHHGHDAESLHPFLAVTLDADYAAAEVARNGEPIYLSSPRAYQRRYPAAWTFVQGVGRESWAYLPLVVGGRIVGVWMAAFAYRVSFTPEERSVLTTVARMLAQALARAGVTESERELANGLQRSMLPTLVPGLPGMNVAARYVPTGGGLQVGGDWYDMIPLPTGRVALCIGDVQGHDVRAAGLMGQLRTALRAYAAEGHTPDAVLSRANRFLSGVTDAQIHEAFGAPHSAPGGASSVVRTRPGGPAGHGPGQGGARPTAHADGTERGAAGPRTAPEGRGAPSYAYESPVPPRGANGTGGLPRVGDGEFRVQPDAVADSTEPRFATCLYVEADPASGRLEIARAGHPNPTIRMADGTVIARPTAGGLPLGVDRDADYPTTRFVLEPGETMMLCTDGLIETGGHDMDSGWSRIRSTLEADGYGSLEELADALVRTVLGPSSYQTTGPLVDRREDDIAVLLLHRSAGPPRPGAARRTALTVAQADPERISSARQQIKELLHDWADGDQVDSAVLLVSEVATNVLVHTDSDALLAAQVTGEPGARRLRVEVSDGSDNLPHKRRPGELASSGRGLVLMELLADTWGVEPRGEGKRIWFEIHESSGSRAGASRGRALPEL